jgi:hypothetical protein
MDSISDRCDAGDIGGNAGTVEPGETSTPAVDAGPTAAAVTDNRHHSVDTGANREKRAKSHVFNQ